MLSHSHSWKRRDSKPVENIEIKWIESDHAYSQHPRSSLDLLCVSDLGLWSPVKFTFIATPDFDSDPKLSSLKPYFPDPLGTAKIAYSGYIPSRDQPRLTDTPIGAFIVRLYNVLAWENASIRALAEYFGLSGIGGNGEGVFRHWPISIYSDELRMGVLNGKASPTSAKIAYSGYIPSRDQPRLTDTPIGAFIVRLYNVLAWENASIRALAEYFGLSGIGANGEGVFRHWPISIYSDELRMGVLNGKASGPLQLWNEWNFAFNS